MTRRNDRRPLLFEGPLRDCDGRGDALNALIVRTVLALTLAVATIGCGDDDSSTPALTADTLNGTYDVTLTAADGRVAGAIGSVVLDAGKLGIQASLDGTDRSYALFGDFPGTPDAFAVTGSETYTDVATLVRGTLAVRAEGDRLVIHGTVDDGGLIFLRARDEPSAGPIDVVLTRPTNGISRYLRGARALHLLLQPSPSGLRTATALRLRIDVARDGSCVSDPAMEDGGDARSRFDAGICQLSPEGRFRLGTTVEPHPPNDRLLGTTSFIGFEGRLEVAGGRVVGGGHYELLYGISPEYAGAWIIQP